MVQKNFKLCSFVRHICIEGAIGVGKTSLCRMLSERFNARLVLEEVEANPFLSLFYSNRRAYAFQTQLWFLVSRYKQLSESFLQQDLFKELTISDYMFEKDAIFAHINLDEHELALYRTVAAALKRNVTRPDFVIYLQASVDILMKRIEKRGRPYEFNIDREYVEMVLQAYNHFFFHYTETPLLIIDTNEIDFVNSPEDFEEIVTQLASTKAGTNYFKPMGSKLRAFFADKQKTTEHPDSNFLPLSNSES